MNAPRRDRLRGGRHRRARAGGVAQATFPTFELHAAPRVSSGLTLPIGRVGALAVALGVGLAFGTGTAYAEDTSSKSDTGKTESAKSSSESNSTSAQQDTATDTDDDSDDSVPRPRPGVSSDPDISDPEDAEPADDDEPTEVDETDENDESASEDAEPEEPAPTDDPPVTAPDSAPDDPPKQSSDDPDQSDPADTAVVPKSATRVSGPRHSAEILSATTGSSTPRVVAGAPTTDTPSPSLPALWSDTPDASSTMVLGAAAAHATAPNPIEVVVGAKISAVKTVLTVTQKILTAFFNPPGGNAQPGLLWVALAWVRREIEHTFFNRTPRVNDQEITLTLAPGDHSLPITLGATDREGDPLTYRVPSTGKRAPEHGTVTIDQATGTLVYTPTDPIFTGTDIFTVKVADRGFHLHGPLGWLFKRHHGHTDTAVITIHLRPEGTEPPTATLTPVARDDTLTTAEDSTGGGNVLANDGVRTGDGSVVDGSGSTLVTSLTAGPTHGRVVLYQDGTYEYTPDADYHGTDSFTYTATTLGAGGGASATATVTVIVTPVNDAPTGLPGQAGFGAEDTTFGGQLLASDIDSAASGFSYAVAGQAQHGTVTVSPTGTWSYSPDPDYTGSDSFTFTVSDGQDVSVPVTVSVSVTAVDDPPVGLPGQSGVGEQDTTFGGQLLAADIDSPAAALSYALAAQAAHGTVSVGADGSWTYTPDAGFHGADSFTFTVSDGVGTSDPARVALTVTPVYTPPTGNPVSAAGDEDQDISGQLTATGGNVSFTLESSPAYGSLTLDPTGSWTYTPDPDFHGTDSFTFTVDDGRSISDPATVTITVGPVNDDPTAQNGTATAVEDGGSVSGSFDFTDVDLGDTVPDQLTVAVTQPAGGTVAVDPSGTGYTYTPRPDFSGQDTFTYTVTDASGAQATGTVTVTVTAVNDRPVATTGLSGTVAEDSIDSVGGSVSGTDVDGDTLGYQLSVQAAHGFVTIDESTGVWTYTPDPDFSGSDTFMFTVHDGTLISTPVEVTVYVPGVNDPPVASGDLAVDTDEDSTLTIPRAALPISDVDGDALTVSIVDPPSHGIVTVDPSGAFVYTPDPDYHGIDSFSYAVSDGHGGTATAGVTIAVASILDPPVANPDSFTSDLNGTTINAADLLANDTDGDDDDLVAIVVEHPVNGSLIDNGDGTFTYLPDDGFSGQDSFTYMASDGAHLSPTAVVTITVVAVV